MALLTENNSDNIHFNNFNSINRLKSGIKINFFPQKNVEKYNDGLKYILNTCKNILNGDNLNISYYKLRSITTYITDKNNSLIYDLIKNLCEDYCKNVTLNIKKILLKNGSLDELLTFIVERHNTLIFSFKFIKRNILWYFDSNTISKENLKKLDYKKKNYKYLNFSVIDSIIQKCFFKYILNVRIRNNNSNEYMSLYKIIENKIRDNNFENCLEKIIKIYNIAKYNYKFILATCTKEVPMEKKTGISFNFCKKLGNHSKFIILLIKLVDGKIRQKKYDNLEFKKQEHSELELLTDIVDKDIIYLLHYKLMSNRLLNNHINVKSELNVIGYNYKTISVNYLMDMKNTICRQMRTMVYDIKRSFHEQYVFNGLNIEIQQPRFIHYSNSLNKKIFKIKMLSEFAWDKIIKDYSNKEYILPTEIILYKQIYEKYFKLRYPEKEMKWLLMNGKSILELYFNKEKYLFETTNIQAIILLQFNNTTEIGMAQLEELTNIPKKEIYKILNCLLNIKPPLFKVKNHLYYINNDFYNDNKNISLINYQNINKIVKNKMDHELAKKILDIMTNKKDFYPKRYILENESFKNYKNNYIECTLKLMEELKYLICSVINDKINYKLNDAILMDDSDDSSDESSDDNHPESEKSDLINDDLNEKIDNLTVQEIKNEITINKKYSSGTKILEEIMDKADN
jgi:hypothetical protein